jgi:hypothetical protein
MLCKVSQIGKKEILTEKKSIHSVINNNKRDTKCQMQPYPHSRSSLLSFNLPFYTSLKPTLSYAKTSQLKFRNGGITIAENKEFFMK